VCKLLNVDVHCSIKDCVLYDFILNVGNVSRFCDSDGQWLTPDASKCYSLEYNDIKNAVSMYI